MGREQLLVPDPAPYPEPPPASPRLLAVLTGPGAGKHAHLAEPPPKRGACRGTAEGQFLDILLGLNMMSKCSFDAFLAAAEKHPDGLFGVTDTLPADVREQLKLQGGFVLDLFPRLDPQQQ